MMKKLKEKKYSKKEIKEFIIQSNRIESEYSSEAIEDSVWAWKYLEAQTKLSLEVISTTHFLMAWRVNPSIAGNWRNCDVWIGGKRKIFVSEALIKQDVDDLLTQMSISPDLPADTLEEFVRECHVRYEEIHPFNDFNGRTGRFFMNWQRYRLGLPIKIIKADWNMGGEEQREYYGWFK